jgi:enoyl-CoA hydratase/carnithine racemase
MEDRIRLTIEDGIAGVRLNRADKTNALDPTVFRGIAEAGARLREVLGVKRTHSRHRGSARMTRFEQPRPS